jgi:D-alanine-D-alanine ligase
MIFQRKYCLHSLVLTSSIDTSRPDELDTLLQAQQVQQCLENLGYSVSYFTIETLHDLHFELSSHVPDVVFNLVESFNGKDAYAFLVAAALETARIPYTGCCHETLYLSCHKEMMKLFLQQGSLPVAESLSMTSSDGAYIVKSLTEHASLGLDATSVVSSKTAAGQLVQQKERAGGRWFAERYIDGREINVSLLEIAGHVKILPPAEILFEGYEKDEPHIVDYAAKWVDDSHHYHATPRRFITDKALVEKLKSLAKHCWQKLDLKGYARIDCRLDQAGKLYIIDVNPNPCLNVDAGFIAAAQETGLSQQDVVRYIIEAALTQH